MSKITTYTKKSFDPTYPISEDIDIRDIAHALSLLCRAGGHFKEFFSVGQHSINCMKEAAARGYSSKVQLACLLHDASEAYLADITRPVKAVLTDYRKYEDILQTMIWGKWLESPLTPEEENLVFLVDDAMLYYEFDHFMQEQIFENKPVMASRPEFGFKGFAETEKEFLRCFNTFLIPTANIPSFTVGIDWKAGKWIAVTQKNGILDYHIFPTIEELCQTYSNADVILIDAPIGLPENRKEAELRPDRIAAKIMGKHSSVFNVPFRQVAMAETDAKAWEWNRKLDAKMTPVSMGIRGAVRTVDCFLQQNKVWKNRLLESHPELAFYTLNDNVQLDHPKKTMEGIQERITILQKYCDINALIQKFFSDVPSRKKVDDLLDAAALAITGKLGMENGFTTVPKAPSADKTGLFMQMVIANNY